MTSVSTILGSTLAWVIAILILALIVSIVVVIIRMIFKKREEHVGVFFEGNFRTIMREWDIITRPGLKSWKSGIFKKLKVLDKDVTGIENIRTDLDMKLSNLEREIGKIEHY